MNILPLLEKRCSSRIENIVLPEETVMSLFRMAYSSFNASIHIYDADPEVREWAKIGESKYNELMQVFCILDLKDRFNNSIEKDVEEFFVKNPNFF